MKIKFKDFLNEELLWSNEDENFKNPVSNIPKSQIIDIFKERGLSCDEKDNWQNEITYNTIENTIEITYTSYKYGGEMPKDLSIFMQEIADILDASDWNFVDPMSKVIFYFD